MEGEDGGLDEHWVNLAGKFNRNAPQVRTYFLIPRSKNPLELEHYPQLGLLTDLKIIIKAVFDLRLQH
jgi:hypothetical protein